MERYCLDTGQRYNDKRQAVLAASLLAEYRGEPVRVFDYERREYLKVHPPQKPNPCSNSTCLAR